MPIESLVEFDESTTTSVTVVDVNGDGLDDVIVCTGGTKPNQIYISPTDGDWSKVTPTEVGPEGQGTFSSTDVKVVDVNGDNVPDLVFANSDGPNQIFLGDPSQPGKYADEPLLFGASGDKTTDVEVIDINDDGARDIIVANDGQQNVVYFGDPSLPLGGTPDYDGGTKSVIGRNADATKSVTVADVNADGKPDVIFGNDGTQDEIFLLTGSSTDLSSAPSTKVPGTERAASQDIKVGDITGDGRPDLVIAVDGAPNLLIVGGANGFGEAQPIGSTSERSMSVELVDVDGDFDLDVVFGNSDGSTE